jgi:hypothetical protein
MDISIDLCPIYLFAFDKYAICGYMAIYECAACLYPIHIPNACLAGTLVLDTPTSSHNKLVWLHKASISIGEEVCKQLPE